MNRIKGINEPSAYVQTIEKRSGIKIGCPEEAPFRASYLSLTQPGELTDKLAGCEYRAYLCDAVAEATRLKSGK